MDINCEFGSNLWQTDNVYSCVVTAANITNKTNQIKAFNGVHQHGRSDKDVKGILFVNTIVDYFPRGLNKHFPNLAYFFINGCGIKEISKEDLHDYKGLSS